MKAHVSMVIGLVLLGCGQRSVGEPDVEPRPDAGTPGSSGLGDGEVVCREGLTPCDGACVDLSSTDEHCGVCNHACKRPVVYGWCRDGECPPAMTCGRRGFQTCNDVCAAHGQVCTEGPRDPTWGGCGGGYQLVFAILNDDPLELCEGGIGSTRGVEATCSSPIDWSARGGLENREAEAVACCCTQEAP